MKNWRIFQVKLIFVYIFEFVYFLCSVPLTSTTDTKEDVTETGTHVVHQDSDKS